MKFEKVTAYGAAGGSQSRGSVTCQIEAADCRTVAEVRALVALAPQLLRVAEQIAECLDTANPEHPNYFDSGSDTLQCLFDIEAQLRATIRAAGGACHDPDAEPEADDDDDECATCFNAAETRVAPCDECGHVDEDEE